MEKLLCCLVSFVARMKIIILNITLSATPSGPWLSLPVASPPHTLSLSPPERLCLLDRTNVNLRLLGVVYRAYHALRLGHRSFIEQCIEQEMFEPILLESWDLCKELWLHHSHG
jgi:hypothetical protein